MTDDKFILLSMGDARSKKISEVLGNKTCKKIIDFLAEKSEASEKDIADSLKMPLNTTEYNLKKLIEAQLVEKTSNFFWSVRGKKIPMYKLSNKSIIISPKNSEISSKLKSIIPVAIISGIAAVLVRYFYGFMQNAQDIAVETIDYSGEVPELALKAADRSIEAANLAAESVSSGGNFFFTEPSTGWIWFLAGSLFGLLALAIWNWRKL